MPNYGGARTPNVAPREGAAPAGPFAGSAFAGMDDSAFFAATGSHMAQMSEAVLAMAREDPGRPDPGDGSMPDPPPQLAAVHGTAAEARARPVLARAMGKTWLAGSETEHLSQERSVIHAFVVAAGRNQAGELDGELGVNIQRSMKVHYCTRVTGGPDEVTARCEQVLGALVSACNNPFAFMGTPANPMSLAAWGGAGGRPKEVLFADDSLERMLSKRLKKELGIKRTSMAKAS